MKKIISFIFVASLLVGSFLVLFDKEDSAYAGVVSNPIIRIDFSTTNGPQPPVSGGSVYGYSMANIGDLNDDGVNDIAVSDPYLNDWSFSSPGGIYIHLMNADGSIISSSVIDDSTPNGPSTLVVSANYGSSIAGIGDLNGDGVEDIAVGASADYNGSVRSGAVYIHFMNTDGSIDSTVRINNNTANGPSVITGGTFGSSVSNLGDLNGDGVQDLLVGADSESSTGTATGAAYILFMNTDGSLDSTVKINSLTANGPVGLLAGVKYGNSVATIGDLNNDGVTDIIVGSNRDGEAGVGSGAAYIHFMNTDASIDSTVKINYDTLNGAGSGAGGSEYGRGLSGIGDLDNDGTEDIAVISQFYMYFHFMNPDGSIRITRDIYVGGGGQFSSLSNTSMGDIDGNGVFDIIDGSSVGVDIRYLDLIPELIVEESGGSTDVAEGGATDSYSVRLEFLPPTGDVTVTLNPDSQITLDKSSITFTTANWQTPQIVNVEAVDDDLVESDHTGTISYTVASPDAKYNNLVVPNTSVNIVDNDTGISHSILIDYGLYDISEDGSAFNLLGVMLSAQPTDDVMVTLAPDSQTLLESASDPIVLTFTDSNWDSEQFITIGAVDDLDIEGYHTGAISVTASSADLNFNNLSIPDIVLNILDNDVGVVISETSSSTDVVEGGATDVVNVSLATEPTDDVTITLANDAQVSSSSNSLTFTAINWGTPQPVTVSAVDDLDIEGDHNGLISFTTASNDANYETLTLSDITVNITDNDSIVEPPTTPSQGSTSGYWVSNIRVKDFKKETENPLIDLEAIASLPVTHYEISNTPDFREKNVYIRDTLIKGLYWDICKGLSECVAGEHKIYARFYWNENLFVSSETSINYIPVKECPEFKSFLKKGSKDNDPEEVKKAQEFLNQEVGTGLVIDGIFGKLTDRAVRDFQEKYPVEILYPWTNLKSSTGWWYITTRSFANKLRGC